MSDEPVLIYAPNQDYPVVFERASLEDRARSFTSAVKKRE
jgi:hypothetical protein